MANILFLGLSDLKIAMMHAMSFLVLLFCAPINATATEVIPMQGDSVRAQYTPNDSNTILVVMKKTFTDSSGRVVYYSFEQLKKQLENLIQPLDLHIVKDFKSDRKVVPITNPVTWDTSKIKDTTKFHITESIYYNFFYVEPVNGKALPPVGCAELEEIRRADCVELAGPCIASRTPERPNCHPGEIYLTINKRTSLDTVVAQLMSCGQYQLTFIGNINEPTYYLKTEGIMARGLNELVMCLKGIESITEITPQEISYYPY